MKKRKHSKMGHLWKVVKNDFLNPKAAAADIQAISLSAASMSVSAAKQAGSAMNSVATKVETEVSNLHDQILGGKRNLPDHSRKLISGLHFKNLVYFYIPYKFSSFLDSVFCNIVCNFQLLTNVEFAFQRDSCRFFKKD